jgi:hypothetical protein
MPIRLLWDQLRQLVDQESVHSCQSCQFVELEPDRLLIGRIRKEPSVPENPSAHVRTRRHSRRSSSDFARPSLGQKIQPRAGGSNGRLHPRSSVDPWATFGVSAVFRTTVPGSLIWHCINEEHTHLHFHEPTGFVQSRAFRGPENTRREFRA